MTTPAQATTVLVGLLLAVLPVGARAGQSVESHGADCVLEGFVLGTAPAGGFGDIRFAHLVMTDVVAVSCDAPVASVVPVVVDPTGRTWVADAPFAAPDRWYRIRARAGATLGTHAVVDAVEIPAPAERSGVAVPVGVRAVKAGNGQPPCTREAWRPEAFPVRLEVDAAGSDDVAPEAALAELRAASEVWESAGCADATIEWETTSEPASLVSDGRNSVSWMEENAAVFANLGAENLAFTCHVCDDDGYFVETDVRFDGERHAWSASCDGAGDAFDIRGTAIHELGHVLGLGHTTDAASVMFPVTSARRLLSRSRLDGEDVDALCARYPCAESDDCSVPIVERVCPTGADVCAPCNIDDACGARGDACLFDGEEARCSRQCSPSFPCPSGFLCTEVASGGLKQCVPEGGGACALVENRGCACDDDAGCGAGAICDDGQCVVLCADGLACADGAACVPRYDADGRPLASVCEPPEEVVSCDEQRKRGCGGCAAAERPAPGGAMLVALALIGLCVRRRQA